jgi:hypothetical protein
MLISIAITACGGGGSLESPGGGSSDKYELVVTLVSADGGDGISEVSKAVPGKLIANLTKNGSVFSNQLITFAIGEQGIGVLNPTSGTAQTNNNGDAEISLHAGTVAGGGTVSASYTTADNDTVTVTHVFTSKGDDESDEDTEYKITLEMKNFEGEIISRLNPSQPGVLTAHLTKNNESVENEIIDFSSANNAVIDSSDSSEQLTDGNGLVSKVIYVGEDNGASSVNVDFIIPGTSTLITEKFNFESQGIGENNGYVLTLELRNQNGDIATELSPSNPVVGIASLTQNGQPVSGRKLSFENIEINEVITDENGQAISVFKQCINEANNCQTSGVASLEVLFSGDENSNGSLRTTKLITEKDEIPVYSYQTKLFDSSNTPVEIITNSDSFHFEVTVFKNGTLVGSGEIIRLETRFNNFPSMDNSNDRTFKEVATDSNGLIKAVIEATGNHADYVTVTIVTPGIIASAADIVVFNSEYTLLEDQFELDLSFENGLPNNTVSGAAPAVLKAKLTKQGVEASNEVIRFAVNDAGLLEEPLKVATDSNGEATIVLNAGTDVGAGIAYATLERDGLVNQVQDSLVFTSLGDGFVLKATLVDENDNELTTISSEVKSFVKATLSQGGTAVSNAIVSFEVDNLGLIEQEQQSQVTDSSGVAKAEILPGITAGTGFATVSYDNGKYSAQVNFITSGDQISIILSELNGLREISHSTPGILIADLKQGNNPLAFKVVTFSVDTVGVINPEIGTAMTDENGRAMVSLLAGTTEGAGNSSVSFTSDAGNAVTDSYAFTSKGDAPVDGSQAFKVEVNITDINGAEFTQSNPVSSDNIGIVTAKVLEGTDPVNNVLVSFSTEFTGEIQPSVPGTAITNTDGIATINLGAGNFKGAGKVIAKYTPVNGSEAINEAVFYSSGDGAPIDSALAEIDMKFLINCKAGWDEDRDVIEIDPLNSDTECKVSNRFSSDELVDVYVKVSDTNTGNGFSNILINSVTTSGRLLPESGAALTDNFGIALLKLQPNVDGGAGEVTTTAKGVSKSIAFSASVAEISMTIDNGLPNKLDSDGVPIEDEFTPLAAGSTTVITVEILDNDNALITTPLEVEFSSGCSQSGLSILDDKVTSTGGIATATYKTAGCALSQGDTVRASVSTGGSVVIKETVIPVSAAPVASIIFDNVTNTVLALKGTGGQGRTENSQVTFKLIDSLGLPSTQSRLDFKLSSVNGGISLSSNSADTDSDGFAQVQVNSGHIPMAIRVQACYIPDDQIPASQLDDVTCWKEMYDACQLTGNDRPSSCPSGTLSLINLDEQIISVSDLLSMSTGLPDNNSFTASPEILNVEALQYTGVIDDLSIYLADQFNNPVPDGTAVYITTEGGAVGTIDGEPGNPQLECRTVDGVCVAQWRSQDPIPFSETKWGNRVGDYNPKQVYKAKSDLLISQGNLTPSYDEIKAVSNSALDPTVLENTRNCDLYNGAWAPCLNGIRNAAFFDDGVPLGARSTLIAISKGEESFVDLNSNGLFDSGEYYYSYDLPEAFIDNNENGTRTAESCNEIEGTEGDPCDPINTDGGHGEAYFSDINVNGQHDLADGKFNGLLCTAAAEADGKCNKELIDVRRNFEIVMSGSTAYSRFMVSKNSNGVNASCTSTTSLILEESEFTDYCDVMSIDISANIGDHDNDADTPDTDIGLTGMSVFFYFTDIYNNPMPQGTTITFSAGNGEYSGPTDDVVGNTTSTTPQVYGFSIVREGTGNKSLAGVVEAKITTPKGNITLPALTILDDR